MRPLDCGRKAGVLGAAGGASGGAGHPNRRLRRAGEDGRLLLLWGSTGALVWRADSASGTNIFNSSGSCRKLRLTRHNREVAVSVNKVILVGNLGKDPELRYTPSGVAVANFSLATTETYKDRDGNRQNKTEWHNIVAWRQLAEICGKYLHKGKQVYIEGKLTTRKWQDRDGVDRYTTEIVADQMQMLGRAGEEGGGTPSPGGRGGNDGYAATPPARSGAAAVDTYEEPSFNPDDEIPF